MSSELHSYFQQVRSYLQLGAATDDEVVRELRTHVEERLRELRRAGASEDEAVRTLLHRLDSPRRLARQFQEAHLRATGHDALLAALPFLLVSALFATHLWRQPLVAFVLAGSIVGMTLNGLCQRRPPWFYAWAGLALTLIAFCGYFAFGMAERAVGLIDAGALDPLSALGLAGAAVYFPLALVVFISCILAACRRDWLDASLMLAPSAPVVVWLAVLHQANAAVASTGTPLTGADSTMALTFLALAVAVAAFVRVPVRAVKLGMLVVGGALLLTAVSYAADPQLPLASLLARGLLLFAFLLGPAALEALVPSWLRPPASG